MVSMKKHPILGIMVRSDGLILHPGHYCCNGRVHVQEHWTKGTHDKDGYLITVINKKKYRIHRIVAETFLENVENKQFVDHINRVRDDNNVENLRWVTQQENNCNTSRSLPKMTDEERKEHKRQILRNFRKRKMEEKRV